MMMYAGGYPSKSDETAGRAGGRLAARKHVPGQKHRLLPRRAPCGRTGL
jgi:hypothetical protein